MGLLDVACKEEVDSNGNNIVSLKIPVKAKPGTKIESATWGSGFSFTTS